MLKIGQNKSVLGRNTMLFTLIIVLQVLGCHSFIQNHSGNLNSENKSLINSQSEIEKKQTYKFDASKSELEKNRRLWRDKEITNYNFISSIFYHRLYNPAVPVLIKVRAAKNISIEPISKSNPGSIEEYKRFDTIEKMFDTIEQMLEAEEKVNVNYNKEIGYPEEIVVDEPKEGGGWFVMNIKKFDIVK